MPLKELRLPILAPQGLATLILEDDVTDACWTLHHAFETNFGQFIADWSFCYLGCYAGGMFKLGVLLAQLHNHNSRLPGLVGLFSPHRLRAPPESEPSPRTGVGMRVGPLALQRTCIFEGPETWLFPRGELYENSSDCGMQTAMR